MTEARLGFAIDSSQAAGAASDLDRLTASSSKAEQAANKVSIAATKASRSFGDISPALERIISGIEQLNQTATSISSKLDAMARAATGAARAAKGIGDAANDAGKSVDNLGDKIRKTGDSGRSFGDQASHVKAFRDEIDRLTAKFQPLTVASKAYEANIAEIQSAHRLGVISAQQMTAELDKERAAFDRLSAAANKVPGKNPNAANSNGISDANKRFIGRDLAFQAQDIAVTAIGGMSPKAIAFQQGTQIAGAVAGLSAKEAGGALLSAATSLVSPLSIASVALTGLTAAAIQYFTNTSSQVKSLDDLLDDHTKIIKRIGYAYGGVAEQATKAGSDSKRLIDALGTRNQTALRLSSASEGNSFFQSSDVGRVLTGGRFGERGASFHAVVPQFQQDLAKLRTDFKAGKPDFDGFYEAISRKVELDPSLAAAGVKVIAESEKFKSASDAMKEYQRVREALFNDEGPNKQLLSQGTTNTADAGNLALYQSRLAVTLRRSQQSFLARTSGIDARTPAELANAARSQASSQYNDGEGVSERNQRINIAGQEAYISARLRAKQAEEDFDRSLQRSIADQKQNISLVGQTGAASETLRFSYDQMAKLRETAIQQGIKGEQDFQRTFARQIDLIKQASEEYGRLVETRARAQLSNDLTFQRDQLGRTPEQRRIADQLRTSGLPVDLTSKSALEIAQTNRALAAQRMGIAGEGFNAQIAGINARTPAERIAAARAAAAAQHNDNETDPERAQRINNAEAIARAQINRQQADADRERSMSLRRLLDQQQQDIDLIGKTGAAAEAAKEQFQLMAELRQQAAQQGITSESDFQTVFAKQIAQIKEASAEYGKLVELRGRTQLNSDLDFQDRQLRRSSRDQQVVTTLRQYGQPEDLNSPDANRIRQQLRSQEEKSAIDQFSTNLASNIVQSGGKIGKAFAQTFLSSLQEAAQKQLTNIFSQLLTSVLMPNATAGTTTASGVAGLGATAVGRLLSPTSLNNSPASPTTQTGVAAQAWNFFAGKGLQPHQIAGVLGNISAESGFNPKAVGDAGKAFGLFQNHAARGGGSDLLASGTSGQLEHAWTELQGPENKAFQALMKSTDVRGATAAFAGFERPRGFSLGNPEGADNFSGRLSAANDALSKFGSTTNQATQGLGSLGNGLGQLGNSLSSSAFPAAPAASGGGGLFGWLGGLFSSPFKAMGPQGAAALAGTLKPGLFASGTNYAPGGPAIVGENGPELLDLPQGSQVTSNHKLMSALAANSNQPQPNRTLMVSVQGASGDDHVRTLVQQGVGAALNDYNTQQRRGGVGVLQARYSNQKV